MDEIYLDYDPRNAQYRVQPGRPFLPFFGGPGMPARPPVAIARPPIVGQYPAHPPAPVAVPYYGAPPAYYPQAYYPPPTGSKLGSKLSDLTVGDVVPLLAQLVIAFRPMPTPPTDEGRLDTNVVNLTKFVDAIGRHFHADQQLQAAGTVAGTFLR